MSLDSMGHNSKRGRNWQMVAILAAMREANKFVEVTPQIERYLADKVIAAASDIAPSHRKNIELRIRRALNPRA